MLAPSPGMVATEPTTLRELPRARGAMRPPAAPPRKPRAPRPPRAARPPKERKPRREPVPVPPQTHRFVMITLGLLAAVFGALAGMMMIYSIDLPQVDELQVYRPMSTTELYDVHGNLVGSFALERRVIVGYDDFSPQLRQAVISIEDKNFDSHWGVNLFRVAGAAYRDLTSNGRAQGASTLTMQLSRNLFLSNERTFSRKMQEVLFSIQVEHHFTKPQIFMLYGNQIYLGHGMYGFEAASEYYYSKHARDLTLPEAALMAGIPKSPTNYSPLLNPEKAIARRNLVLTEMENDGAITPQQAERAREAPLGLHLQPPANSEAPWFVEEVRRTLEKQFGPDQVHEGGLKIYTTMDLSLQQTATRAVLDGLAAYEKRHGWKGHLQNVVAQGDDINTWHHPDWAAPVAAGGYAHGVVTFVVPDQVSVKIGTRAASINPDAWAWTGQADARQFLKQGDVVYIHVPDAPQTSQIWQVSLEQDSGAQGSLLAMDNASGDVLAMVGGRDFALSQFNRATQAERQTGSSFKPFVYAAAVERGAKPGDRIEDTPATFATPGGPYTPHNYDNAYRGNMSLLAAFADSRNIPALRLAQRVGIHNVIDLAHRCGITSNIKPFLPVALGSADITLEQQVGAYSVFPNDGLRVPPRLVRRVTTADGRVLSETKRGLDVAMDQKTSRTMVAFLQSVIQMGTGAAARELKHPIGGKTGTTNDFTDAWFMGFSPSVTTGVWVGYDDRQSLGERETGARAALPIWIDFMRAAVARHPGEQFEPPTPAPAPRQTLRLAKTEKPSALSGPVAKPVASSLTAGYVAKQEAIVAALPTLKARVVSSANTALSLPEPSGPKTEVRAQVVLPPAVTPESEKPRLHMPVSRQ